MEDIMKRPDIHLIRISERYNREIRANIIFKERIAKKFLDLLKDVISK